MRTTGLSLQKSVLRDLAQFTLLILALASLPSLGASSVSAVAEEFTGKFEPKLALDGGADGLSCYRAVIASLPKHLSQNGMAILELGLGQQQAVEQLAIQNGLKPVGVAHDLQGIARALIMTH